jgi:hypothetical protein
MSNSQALVRLGKLHFTGVAAMPINSYLEDGVFRPEAVAAMGEAFDAACKELHVADPADARRALIASLIIAAARRGELNPVRLRATAVAVFAIAKSPPELDASKTARAAS